MNYTNHKRDTALSGTIIPFLLSAHTQNLDVDMGKELGPLPISMLGQSLSKDVLMPRVLRVSRLVSCFHRALRSHSKYDVVR
jgi:hypothetical protein